MTPEALHLRTDHLDLDRDAEAEVDSPPSHRRLHSRHHEHSPTPNHRDHGGQAHTRLTNTNSSSTGLGRDMSAGVEHNGGIRSSSPQPHNTTTPDSHRDAEQHEHGLRVEKRRHRAAGFLLPSSLRDARRHRAVDEAAKGKEKASSSVNAVPSSASHLTTTPGRSNGSSMRSSPLAQVVVSPRPSYGDGSRSRLSTEVDSRPISVASGSQPRPSSDYTIASDGGVFGGPQNGGAAIDPAQIVSMALNLSEGRRRHLSAGQLLQQQPGGARRATSAVSPSPALLQGSFQNAGHGHAGGSLSQAMRREQKRGSRNNSPGSNGKGTTPKRHTSAAQSFIPPDALAGSFSSPDIPYRFSPSTLARAEKARQYIELSVEYRRLLDYLPPLRPDGSAPGNFELTSHSVPGTPNVELTRTPTVVGHQKHELGRRYDPLQMIRNRKLRMRSRMYLKPDVEAFTEMNTVRDWIDLVEDMSHRPGYRTDDRVRLPLYPEEGSATLNVPGHQRNDSTNKPKRQRSDWFFTPSEHLADAYWMETDSHKRLIENRHGNKIFPAVAVADMAPPRGSYESRRSHSVKGSIVTSNGSIQPLEIPSDDDKDSARGHRHHVRGHHRRDESRGRLKQVWHKARRKSRSSSSGLSSSDEGPLGPAKGRNPPRIPTSGENVGPLEKQMNQMLSAQSQDKTPDLVSPGTPNKWGTTISQIRTVDAENKFSDSDQVPQEGVGKEHGRKLSTLTPDSARARGATRYDSPSSFEDLNSTGPNSPLLNAHAPPIGMDLSPAGSRATSPPRRLGKPLLPFMRHEQGKVIRKGSSGDDGNQSSRQTSAEVTSNPRHSLDVPSVGERIKLHRHKTSGSMHELTTMDTRESREPQSAVRRFFKGGRIGEIVRNEGAKVTGRGRKREATQDDIGLHEIGTDTDTMEESDTEEIDLNSIKDRPLPPRRTNTGWSTKYNSDKLPSFRSAKANGNGRRGSDHISKQQRELENNKSSRFESLAPPGLDLSRISTSTSNIEDLSRTNTVESPRRNAYAFASQNRNRSRLGSRLEAILDVPGSVGSGGLPVTGLAEVSNEKPPARPGMKDKRQWSISDHPRSHSRGPPAPKLEAADIARVRALLICSGIKAYNIGHRAFERSAVMPEFLIKAAETCSQEVLPPVNKSEEHVLAAKLLTTHLELETSALQDDAERFLARTVADLKTQLDDVTDQVEACIASARDLGDTCVGFGSEVTGQRTLQVRQVVERLEKLARARRRRLRWLRRLGFGFGEWAVVLVMWWIWLLVMVVKMVWSVLRGVGRSVRWVLWL